MNDVDMNLAEACTSLVKRAIQPGNRCDRSEMMKLNADSGSILPTWFIDMMTSFPLAGLELRWQFDPSDDEDGVAWIVLADVAMLQELLKAYPAVYLVDRGYFPIGYGTLNAGNVFLMRGAGDATSTLFELWHDVSHDPDVLVRALEGHEPGATVVAKSFVEFLESRAVGEP